MERILARRLRALGYTGGLSKWDPSSLVPVVCFLEDRVVRQWKIEDRAVLRAMSYEWTVAFGRYLSEAGCPLPADCVLLERVAWLAGHAVAIEYEDRAGTVNSLAHKACSKAGRLPRYDHASRPSAEPAAAAGLAAGDAARPRPAPEPVDLDEVMHHCRTLCEMLHIPEPASGEEVPQALELCHQCLRQRVLPIAREVSREGAGEAGAREGPARRALVGSEAARAALSLPPGVHSGDPVVDRAVTVLRMMYVADLRVLQDRINAILETVQEFTANPITDSRLGQVGR